MAKLELDIVVKGEQAANNAVTKLGKSAERAEQKIKKISTGSGFTKLAGNIELAQDAIRKTLDHTKLLSSSLKSIEGRKLAEVAAHAKSLLVLEGKINSELEKQARLQAKIVLQGGAATKQQAALRRRLQSIKTVTSELQKQLKTEDKIIDKEKEIARAKKFSAAAARLAAEAERKRLKSQSDYWMAHIRYQKDLERTKARSGSATKSALGTGVVAGGVAGLTVGGISAITSAVGILVRGFVDLTRTAAESFYTINRDAEQTRILLSTALGSEQLGMGMFDEILDMAEKMPFSIKSISDSFVKLQTAGITDAADKVTILADAIAAFGGNDEDLHLATIAIQQMAGKGVVSMEELRRQLGERVPTAIRSFAREMNMSYLELVDKISSGNLMFDEKTQAALFRGLGDHAGAAEKRMNSMEGAVVALRNEWARLMIGLGDSNGTFSSLVDVVNSFTMTIRAFRESDAGKKVIDSLSRSLIGLFEAMQNPDIITTFFGAMEEGIQLAISGAQILLETFETYIRIKEGSANRPDALISAFDVTPTQEHTQRPQSKTMEAIKQVSELFNKFKVEAEIPVKLDVWHIQALDKIKEVQVEEDKLAMKLEGLQQYISGQQDAKFELELELLTNEEQFTKIVSTVESLKRQAAEVTLDDAGSFEKQYGFLEKAKKLLESMEVTGRQVSKNEVAAAKTRWEYQQRITRGGQNAYGDAATVYKEAYREYMKLKQAQESGKPLVDEKALASQKQGIREITELMLKNIQDAEKSKQGISDIGDKAIPELSDSWKNHGKVVTEINNTIGDGLEENTQYIREQIKELERLQRASAKASSSNNSQESGTDGRRALGGPVTAGKSYTVGEAGVEVFTPNMNGFITPNNKLREGNKQQMVDINLSIDGGKSVQLQGPQVSVDEINRQMKEQRRYAA